MQQISSQLQTLQGNVNTLQTTLSTTVNSEGYSNISSWVSETDAAVALYQQIIIQNRDEVIAFRDQLNTTSNLISETLQNTQNLMQRDWQGLTSETREALFGIIDSFKGQLNTANRDMLDMADGFNTTNKASYDAFMTSIAANYSSPSTLIQNTLTAIATNVAAVNAAIASLSTSVTTTAEGFNNLKTYAEDAAKEYVETQFPTDVAANKAQLVAVFKSNVIDPNSAAVTAGYQTAMDKLKTQLISLAANDTVNEQQLRLAFSTNKTGILNTASKLAQLPLQVFSDLQSTQATAQGHLLKTEAAFDSSLTAALNTAQAIAENTQASSQAAQTDFTTVHSQINSLLTGGSATLSSSMENMLAGLEIDVGDELLSSANGIDSYERDEDLIKAASNAKSLSDLMKSTQPNALKQLQDVEAAIQLSNETIVASQSTMADTLNDNKDALEESMEAALSAIEAALNKSIDQVGQLLNSSGTTNAGILTDEFKNLDDAVIAFNTSSLEASGDLLDSLTNLNTSVDDRFTKLRDADIAQTGIIGNALKVAETVTGDMGTLLTNTRTKTSETKEDVDDALEALGLATKTAEGEFDLEASTAKQALDTQAGVTADAVKTAMTTQLNTFRNLLSNIGLSGTEANGRINTLVNTLNTSTIAFTDNKESWLGNLSEAAANVTSYGKTAALDYEGYVKDAMTGLRSFSAAAIIKGSQDAATDVTNQLGTFDSTVVQPAISALNTALGNDATTLSAAQISVTNLKSIIESVQAVTERFTGASGAKFGTVVSSYQNALTDHATLNGSVSDYIKEKFGAQQDLINSDKTIIEELEAGVSGYATDAVAALKENLTSIVDETSSVVSDIQSAIETMGQSTTDKSSADQAAEQEAVSAVTLALGKLSSDVSTRLGEAIADFVSSDAQIRSMGSHLSQSLVDANIPGFKLTAQFSDDATAAGVQTAKSINDLADLINDHSEALESLDNAGQQSIAVTAGAAADALSTAVSEISGSALTLSNSAATTSATALKQLSETAGSFGVATASLSEVNTVNDAMISSILEAVSKRQNDLVAYMAGNASSTGDVAAALKVLVDNWGELSSLALESTRDATKELTGQASALQSDLQGKLEETATTVATGISGPTKDVALDLADVQQTAQLKLPIEDALIGVIRSSLSAHGKVLSDMKGLQSQATTNFGSLRGDKAASNSVSTKLSGWFARFQTALNDDIATIQQR